MKRILIAAVVTMFAFSVPAVAGIGEGNVEVGFDYGSTDYDSDTGFDSGDSINFRGGYFMNDMFEIEGQFMTSDEQTTISGIDAEIDMSLLMVNGVFNFHPRKNIVPYFRGGIGVSDVEVKVAGLGGDDSSVAYQVGAGSRFFFGKSKRAAIRVDVSVLSANNFDDSSTNTTYGVGFSWRIGSGQ